MTLAVREAVCNAFGQITAGQRADLMDDANGGTELATHGTSTTLIEFLSQLFAIDDGKWEGKLVCTAVRSDHPTPDGPNGHEGGNAIDYSQIANPDNAPEHLVADTQSCENARGVELNGPFKVAAQACGGYSAASKLFEGDDTDHLHVQVVGY